MTFRFGAIALALVVVVAATGCGSKKKAAATTTTAPAVTTTATTNSSSGSGGGGSTTTAPTTTSSSKPSFESIKNCAQLESLGKKFSAAIQASTGVGAGGKIDFTKEEQLFKALADASPSAIHGDFETLASAFAASAGAFQKANITAGKTPTPAQLAELEAAGKAFSAPKVAAAEQHLETWATTNCAGVK
jgi:hypothetical protein